MIEVYDMNVVALVTPDIQMSEDLLKYRHELSIDEGRKAAYRKRLNEAVIALSQPTRWRDRDLTAKDCHRRWPSSSVA